MLTTLDILVLWDGIFRLTARSSRVATAATAAGTTATAASAKELIQEFKVVRTTKLLHVPAHCFVVDEVALKSKMLPSPAAGVEIIHSLVLDLGRVFQTQLVNTKVAISCNLDFFLHALLEFGTICCGTEGASTIVTSFF